MPYGTGPPLSLKFQQTIMQYTIASFEITYTIRPTLKVHVQADTDIEQYSFN